MMSDCHSPLGLIVNCGLTSLSVEHLDWSDAEKNVRLAIDTVLFDNSTVTPNRAYPDTNDPFTQVVISMI